MGTYGWGKDNPVIDWLGQEGYLFDFYQAVRLLEIASPHSHPVGESADAGDEAVRFHSTVSLAFPASEVDQVTRPKADGPADMNVNFFGLAGSGGPLPLAYTELLIERLRHKDTAFRDFLDIFNHRLVSLMYRSRRIHRIGLEVRSPEQSDMAGHLYAIMGLGTPGLRDRLHVDDRTLLYYAGIISHQARSMAGLEALLSDYFGVPVHGEQLHGRWLRLEDDLTTKIGPHGQNQRLGENVVLGTRFWDQQGKFELHLGPMSYDQFIEFLPTQKAHISLCELTRFYVGEEFDFDLILRLRPDEVLPLQFGSSAPRLGWTSWLAARDDSKSTFQVRLQARCI